MESRRARKLLLALQPTNQTPIGIKRFPTLSIGGKRHIPPQRRLGNIRAERRIGHLPQEDEEGGLHDGGDVEGEDGREAGIAVSLLGWQEVDEAQGVEGDAPGNAAEWRRDVEEECRDGEERRCPDEADDD